jgi:DNA-binding Xre family transcriptional regulator
MAKKIYRGKSRGRRLTHAEADRYRKIRHEVECEIPPAKPDAMKVAIAQLRALRQAQGISLAMMAERTGMTRGNVARLESQKNATLRTLERYAEALGCALQIEFVQISNSRGKGDNGRGKTAATR